MLFCTLKNCWQLQAEQQAMFTITKSLLTFKSIHIPIPKPRKIKPISTGALKSTTFLFTSTPGRDYKCSKESWGTTLHILFSSYQTQLDTQISKGNSPNTPAISQYVPWVCTPSLRHYELHHTPGSGFLRRQDLTGEHSATFVSVV